MMLSSSFAASGLEEIMDSVSTDEVKNIQIVIIVDGTVLNKFQHLIQVWNLEVVFFKVSS